MVKIKAALLSTSLLTICQLMLLTTEVHAQVSGGIGREERPPIGGIGESRNPGRTPDRPPSNHESLCRTEDIECQRQAERDARNRIEQEKSIVVSRTVTALGRSSRECTNEALDRANSLRYDALRSCRQQSNLGNDCYVQDVRLIDGPDAIRPVSGRGDSDSRKTTVQECLSHAENEAVSTAISNCQNKYGVSCHLLSGPSRASHKVERRRRYIIMGPKENYNVCTSHAEATVNVADQFICKAEIIVRTDVR